MSNHICNQETSRRMWCRTIGRAFSDLTGTPHPENTFSWNVSIGNGDGRILDAMAVIERHEWWLHLGASLEMGRAPARCSTKRAWELLAFQGGLPGGVKYATGAGCRNPVIRADIPLVEGNGFLPLRIKTVFDGFLQAHEGGGGESKAGPVKPAAIQEEGCVSPQSSLTELLKLCRGSGWECDERESGVMVNLETPGDFSRATLETLPDGGSKAMVTLTSDKRWPEPCREALAMMFLRLNAAVPMVRAVITKTAEQVKTGLEVMFPHDVRGNELDRGLAALSDACGLYGREVKILRDKTLAGYYLAVRR